MKAGKLGIIGLILAIGLFFTVGCIGPFAETEEENGAPPTNGEDLTGTTTYSGTWTGQYMGDDVSGEWQFEVDFDAGEVTGWFEGDAAGDISGSVSDGVISAEGDAALGTVSWSGSFTHGGSQIAGDWEFVEGLGSGTWEGAEKETEENDEDDENGEVVLPTEDQISGEEPIDRYPGSVMLDYLQIQTDEQEFLEIEYGTEDSVADIVDWYEGTLGDASAVLEDGDVTQVVYEEIEIQGEPKGLMIGISTDEYTTIDVHLGDY